MKQMCSHCATVDGQQHVPQQPAAVPQGHDQRGDGRTVAAVPHHGRFQPGDGQEGLRKRGRPVLVGHCHVQLFRHQQRSSAAQGEYHNCSFTADHLIYSKIDFFR